MKNGLGIYLSYEAADQITICNLRDTIEAVEKLLADLLSVENPSTGQKRDIADNTKILVHLKSVLEYYGG